VIGAAVHDPKLPFGLNANASSYVLTRSGSVLASGYRPLFGPTYVRAVKRRALCAFIPSKDFKSKFDIHREFSMRLIIKFFKDENAATAIEYGLIASGIAVAVIPVITGLGTHLKATFSTISTALK
jgi:pilus assembly protein Flp/PilA